MATITKRQRRAGRASYQVRIRLRGEYATATFPTLEQAESWAKKTEAAIVERRYGLVQEEERHSLKDLSVRYGNTSIGHLAPAEQGKRITHLEWWCNFLGPDLLLSELTPPRIVEGRDELARSEVVASTVNRYLASLSHACNTAVREWMWLRENPVAKVKRLRESRGRVRFLFQEERKELKKACAKCRDPRLLLLFELAISTGARRGELLALRWRDVDFERKVAILENTKNGDRRALTPSDEAFKLLEEHRKVRRIDSDLIFVGRRGRLKFPRVAWLKALEESGVEDFRFHDLRHTFASYLAMSGASLMEIAAALGHRTLAMVQRYSHLTDQHQAAVVRKMHRAKLG